MSAIVNSNNVIFSNGGASAECPISASFVVGGIDNSKVSAMTFKVVRPTQSLTGNTVTIRNEMGSTGEFALIPYTNEAGPLQYNSGYVSVGSPYSVSSQTTSTSGCVFYGSTAYSAHYVFLNSNEDAGQPYGLVLPAKSDTDIFYNGTIDAYDSDDYVTLRFGVKSTTTTAEDFVDDFDITFPKTVNDGGARSDYAVTLRVSNNNTSPMTVYPAIRTDWHGAFPEGSQYWIGNDSIKTRSYPL